MHQNRADTAAPGTQLRDSAAVDTTRLRREFLEDGLSEAAERYLRQGNRFVYLACTGAGAGLQELLWRTPGASRMLAGASFPYAMGAPERFVQQRVEKAVSLLTALQLASAAFLEAQRAQSENGGAGTARECVGFGLTAAVPTDRTRRGNEEVYAALVTETGTRSIQVTFEKGAASRAGADLAIKHIAFNLLLEEAGLQQVGIPEDGTFRSPNLVSGESGLAVRASRHTTAEALKLWDGRSLFIAADGTPGAAAEFTSKPHVLIPASINPFHWGHDAIAVEVAERSGLPVAFELSLDNIDKPEIPIEEALRRTEMLRGRWPVIVSKGAPLLIDKSRRYGSSFGMGMDTALRVVSSEPRYCRDLTPEGVLAEIMEQGGKLYVGTRQGNSAAPDPKHIAELVKTELREVFEQFPMRCNVSSSALKAAKSTAH